MGKSKNKGLSDKVRSKQKIKAKQPPNPFEIKVNKIKHTVVNKKLQKWEKGVPGVSRSKAVKQRKDTLLKELHHMQKSNSLLDKRFGENDSTLSADEKMVQRFAMEKQKQARKDFSLNEEEEVLTHYGQSLAENLKDTIGSDSEEENDDGKLRMGDLQFGGFSKDGNETSWKDKMKEVIADSKKQKYDRQAEKEKTLEATKDLDSSWKVLASNFKAVQNKQTNRKASTFMQLFHNLVLEQKSSGATDKLKTEEEKAKEEAEKLKQLEAERIARMKGNIKVSKSNHISADDLNDGFAVDKTSHSVSFAELDNDKDKQKDLEVDTSNEDKNDESDEEGSDGGDDDDGDGSDEESDNYSDLESETDSEEDDDDSSAQKEKAVKQKQKVVQPKSILKKNQATGKNTISKTVINMTLPFVFPAPGSYQELKSLLHGHSAEEQSTILSRLRKCHHPSLAEGNKEKLEKIQLYLIQYFGEIVKQHPIDSTLVDHVTSNLWDLAQIFKTSTATAMQNILLEHQKLFTALTLRKNRRGTYPEIDTLIYLKLVECLFPTSDFQHPVTTPALHFITQLLSECSLRTYRDVVAGLFVCALAVKFVSLSKRYVPEVVTFLHGLLTLGTDKVSRQGSPLYAPLRAGGKTADLHVQQKCLVRTSDWPLSEMLNKEPEELNNDQFRYEAIDMGLELLLDCAKLWEDLPCLALILEPCMRPISKLPKHLYPVDVETKIESLIQRYNEVKSKKIKVMQQPSKKPVPLKLFEPEIQEFWTGKQKKGGPNKEVNERQRLNHKYKRELKAAIREIKRDNEVLARHQLDTIMKNDAERKRKTNELMHSLANQEGDYNAIKKMKI